MSWFFSSSAPPSPDFSRDDLQTNSDGDVTSLSSGEHWTEDGIIISSGFYLLGIDDLSGLSDGAIVSVTSGSNWLSAGSFNTP